MHRLSSDIQNILYIEDDAALARLMQKRIERSGFSMDIASSGEEGLERIRQKHYDLILLDHHLPGMSGLDVLDALSPLSHWPPVIIITGGGDERIALQALEKGAADYAVKDIGQFYIELLPAIMQAAYTRDKLMRENEIQRRELEAAKEKAEAANRAKSDFLATMSHEIRTPMNAVVGLAALLAAMPLSAKQKEMVQTLRTNADVLLKLINNLLDLSRIEAGQIELENSALTFAPILKDIESMFALQAKQKGLSLTLHDNTGDAQFLGDRTRLQQVMLNLVGNAVKFTDEGGIDVTVTCGPEAEGKSAVQVRVKDTGIGIPQERITQIFDKFVQADGSITRRFGGSGLGLAISKRLSQLMGGDIQVESREGEGSEFIVTWKLTLAKEENDAPLADAAAGESSGSHTKGTVLLVEDYPANVMVATMMLENLGYTVETAESGRTAVGKVQAATVPYKAILMDVQMNDMDGYEATRRIRELEKEKGFRHTIIGVTAHALAGHRERCIDAGMDDYMSKPIHPDVLAQKMRHLRPLSATTAIAGAA